MLTLRSKLLLALMVVFGFGIGILSGQRDGLYSAVCTFALPIFVALAGASIIADLGQEHPRKAESPPTENKQQDFNRRHAA